MTYAFLAFFVSSSQNYGISRDHGTEMGVVCWEKSVKFPLAHRSCFMLGWDEFLLKSDRIVLQQFQCYWNNSAFPYLPVICLAGYRSACNINIYIEPWCANTYPIAAPCLSICTSTFLLNLCRQNYIYIKSEREHFLPAHWCIAALIEFETILGLLKGKKCVVTMKTQMTLPAFRDDVSRGETQAKRKRANLQPTLQSSSFGFRMNQTADHSIHVK